MTAVGNERPIYWGDLHNHNSSGAAKGSMERTIDIARHNLDFFAYTGQSQWHDMEAHDNGIHRHWEEGFARHQRRWPVNQAMIEKVNEPGRFVAFSGYEWHSSTYGDYNIIFPDDRAELGFHDALDDFTTWARAHDALLIPHHLAYPTGARGANWDHFPADVSPVVEIFSEHGACERDDGPYPYVRHGLGARASGNTYQGALARGLRVGAVAGTDTHVGFPGAYAQGLTAVQADTLDRPAVIEALWERRVYAVTGDRIELSFRLNGHDMGSVTPPSRRRIIDVAVSGWDRIRDVEILRNNTVIHRYSPTSRETSGRSDRFVVRLEFGWGPWAALGIPRVCDWDMNASVTDGRLIGINPCFGSDPFDDDRRSLVLGHDESSCHWISYTSRHEAFEERPNAMAFEIAGSEDTQLNIDLAEPVRKRVAVSLGELAAGHLMVPVGGFQSELVYLHRPVTVHEYTASFTFTDDEATGRPEDHYYVRVTQDNGQMAWSSPIWVVNAP